MSSIKHWDFLVQNAGPENVASFLDNVSMMFQQELDALKSSAESGDAAQGKWCPVCRKDIVGVFAADDYIELRRYKPQGGPPYYQLDFSCPYCKENLSVHVVLMDIEIGLPF